MNTRDLSRIERLVSLSERKRDEVSAVLAQRERELEAAVANATEAEARYAQASDEPLPAALTADELANRRGYVRSLRGVVDRAELETEQRQKAASDERARVADAQREVRKMERWAEGVSHALGAASARRERTQADEHAARKAQKKQP